MDVTDIADQYYTYEGRLASFQTAHQLSKRRGSNANSKAPKSMKWPHKFLSGAELARAGLFYYPSQSNPDNVTCYLCEKSIDGWEEGDDPFTEHLTLSPDCGWAIVATVEKAMTSDAAVDEELGLENPMSKRMMEARTATFADKWPHETKKGWKCKVKQLVDAGWKYTPTAESDDAATCAYCLLTLDGWDPADKPMDEHKKRVPECTFFALIEKYQQLSPAAKRSKPKKARASRVSRLSTQSAFTVASDGASILEGPTEDGDSILTTATTASTAKTMGRPKKAAGKGRKTKAKKSEAVEVEPVPEVEEDDVMDVEVAQKPIRGRKRKSEQNVEGNTSVVEVDAPPPKRRATRTRGSRAVDESILGHDESMDVQPMEAPKATRTKRGRTSTRKASTASMAPSRAAVPNDDELDAALEADLERHLTDDEVPVLKKSTKKKDHQMFSTEQAEIDEAAIEAELASMEKIETKPLPKAKGAKGKQGRKPSAKQQAAAQKAAEAELEAKVAAEEAEAEAQEEAEEAAQQIAIELENSISTRHSSPIIQPKRAKAPAKQAPARAGRSTRGSVLAVNESVISTGAESVLDEQDDFGNDTDASVASQSTVVRGGAKPRRGSVLKKKGKAGKKTTSKNIEEIVHPTHVAPTEDARALPDPTTETTDALEEVDIIMTEVVEEKAEDQATGKPAQMGNKVKAVKGKGRPPKTAVPAEDQSPDMDYEMEEPAPKSKKGKGKETVRSPTPPPKELTPSQSPQSSDAENHPPSSKPSAASKAPLTPRATTSRIPLANATPFASPSKHNIIAGLQSTEPWTAVDLDLVFLTSPGDENALFNGAMDRIKNGELTSPEKKMSVNDWILYNAELAEEKLRSECERMVGRFELEGSRAMRVLEGLQCAE